MLCWCYGQLCIWSIFHLFKTTKGQMATDMLIVRQNMMRLIPIMNKTYIKPLNYYTAATYEWINEWMNNVLFPIRRPVLSQDQLLDSVRPADRSTLRATGRRAVHGRYRCCSFAVGTYTFRMSAAAGKINGVGLSPDILSLLRNKSY